MTLLPTSSAWLADIAPFRRVRLVAIDVDGTLVDRPHSELAHHIRQLARTLRSPKYGVKLTLATGRAFHGVDLFWEALRPLSMPPLVLYNGAVTYDAQRDSIVSLTVLPQAACESVLSAAQAYGARALFYSVSMSKHSSGDSRRLSERVYGFGPNPVGELRKDFNGLGITWQGYSGNVPVDTVAVLIPADVMPAEALTGLSSTLRDNCSLKVTTSGSQYIEVTSRGVDKGVALSALASSLGLAREEVAAIGDNDNDVEMLEWVGCGIAVANASQAAISASSYIARRPGASGVVEFLRLLGDSHRYAGV